MPRREQASAFTPEIAASMHTVPQFAATEHGALRFALPVAAARGMAARDGWTRPVAKGIVAS